MAQTPSHLLSVLVVDDHNDTAESYGELLTLWGYDVQIAACGHDALHKASIVSPDIILLDIGLPDMTGWEVARRLRDRGSGKQPLIVAVTGCGTEEDRARSADSDIDLHLVKPTAPSVLANLFVQVSEILGAGECHDPLRM